MMEKAELVFVPSPAIGHVVASIEIAKLLTRQDDRISVTVLIMNLEASSSANFFADLVRAHALLVRDAVAKRQNSGSVRLAGLVIDMFCTPMIHVANEFGLPSYIYFTSSSAFLGFLLHLQSLHDDESVDVAEFKGSDADQLEEVPSFVNSVPAGVFPSVVLDKESGRTDVFLYHVRRFIQVKGIVVNTFMELESRAVNSFCSVAVPLVCPVGPILNAQFGSGGVNKMLML
ncbi:hypothetical protein VitviT2T_018515 [Vitis vinifera]|uniref:Uncharacterized protein n=1 Tax=Vitis vinifera TaxID=29760 RepID=A0ABY9CY98_VITVI|nr:hypothetical protein VitviT2T_018515 [Vitis vinifera]